MTSSIIDKFLFQNYTYSGFCPETFRVEGDEIILKLTRKGREATCPKCGKTRRAEEIRKRTARILDANRPVCIEFGQAKIRCSCGFRGNETLEFVGRHSRHTKRFEEKIVILSNRFNFHELSKMYNIEWKSVKQIEDDLKNGKGQ
jgi:transposase